MDGFEPGDSHIDAECGLFVMLITVFELIKWKYKEYHIVIQ